MTQEWINNFEEKRPNRFTLDSNTALYKSENSALTKRIKAWVVYCDKHKDHHVLRSRRTSIYLLANPQVWCNGCKILSNEKIGNRFSKIRRNCSSTVAEILETFEMFCPVCGEKMYYVTLNQRDEYFYACDKCGEREKIKFHELPGFEKIKSGDFESCPHCHGSFSFSKPKDDGICPWCKENVLPEEDR